MAHLAEDPNDPDPDDTPLTAHQIRAKLAVKCALTSSLVDPDDTPLAAHQIRAKLAVTDSCQKKMQA